MDQAVRRPVIYDDAVAMAVSPTDDGLRHREQQERRHLDRVRDGGLCDVSGPVVRADAPATRRLGPLV